MERNSFSMTTRLALHEINRRIIHSTPGRQTLPAAEEHTPSKSHTTTLRFLTQSPISEGGDAFPALQHTSLQLTQGMTYRGGWDAGEPRSPHHGCTGHQTQPHHRLHHPASQRTGCKTALQAIRDITELNSTRHLSR